MPSYKVPLSFLPIFALLRLAARSTSESQELYGNGPLNQGVARCPGVLGSLGLAGPGQLVRLANLRRTCLGRLMLVEGAFLARRELREPISLLGALFSSGLFTSCGEPIEGIHGDRCDYLVGSRDIALLRLSNAAEHPAKQWLRARDRYRAA